MSQRKRKKKPPDPRLYSCAFPLDRSLPVDLTSYLLYPWFHFQSFHFPCSIFDYGVSVVPISSQVHFLSQPAVGFHRRIYWFKIHRLSSMIQMELCIQTSSVCVGLAGYRRGVSLVSIMVPIFQTRGSRSATVERRWPDWHLRLLRFELYSLLFFRQTQVCSHLPPLFLTVLLGYFRALFSIVV